MSTIFDTPSGNTLLTGALGAAPNPLTVPSWFGHSSKALTMAVVPTYQWFYVRRRFEQFLENIKLTSDQVDDGLTKQKGVVSSLNRAYWDESDSTAHQVIIGSWAKQTRVCPPRDVDLLFILPFEVHQRFEQRQGNRQSQLLQEVRDRIRVTYPSTDIRGDGQVVVVSFNTYRIEVAPAFYCQGGGYLICDSNGGGRYKHVDPNAEMSQFSECDGQYNGNVRKLARLLKQWQRECDVPIKSFHIEAAIKGTLSKLAYGGNNEFWFDWLVRDTLAHLTQCSNGSFTMPGTGEVISVGNAWLSQAQSAYARAVNACDYERRNEDYLAGFEWQKIFGRMIPVSGA